MLPIVHITECATVSPWHSPTNWLLLPIGANGHWKQHLHQPIIPSLHWQIYMMGVHCIDINQQPHDHSLHQRPSTGLLVSTIKHKVCSSCRTTIHWDMGSQVVSIITCSCRVFKPRRDLWPHTMTLSMALPFGLQFGLHHPSYSPVWREGMQYTARECHQYMVKSVVTVPIISDKCLNVS